MIHTSAYIHPTAAVEEGVEIEEDAHVWHFCQVRKGAIIERGVSLGKGVYVDVDVRIGRRTRIQNGVSVFSGVDVSPWCFIGPNVTFTNDLYPRSGIRTWSVVNTHLSQGVSIGAGAVIRCGITLGAYCMIGAGAIVTKSVPDFHLSVGVPAQSSKMICACGQTLLPLPSGKQELLRECCQQNLEAEMHAEVLRYLDGR